MVVGTQPRCLLEFRGLGHTEIPLGREAMLPQPGSASGCRGGRRRAVAEEGEEGGTGGNTRGWGGRTEGVWQVVLIGDILG